MSGDQRAFYASSNGDVWLLVREEGTADWLVRHQANAASGGHVTELPLAALLAQSEHKPEHQELLRTLTESVTAGAEPQWQPAETAREGVLILVCGPFGIATAQRGLGEFWGMAGTLEAYDEIGDLLMLEGVTGWMMLPAQAP